jgi:HlyD family secretion protein
LVVVIAGGAIAVGITDPFTGGGRRTSGVTDNAYPTSTTQVTRQDLSSQTSVSATLGYAGDYNIVNQASGILTSLPQVGQVIPQGQILYEVSGQPVVLLYGFTPAYCSLSQGSTGPDVQELNADLVAVGDASSDLNPTSDSFSAETASALEKLQSALGVPANGTLSLGQAVFLPTAARITTVSATLGGSAQAGQAIMSATSTARVVTIALDAAQQSEVKVGDRVTITLPNNQTTPGVVSQVGTVATSPSSSSSDNGPLSSPSNPTVTVLVTPSDPTATGSLDQAPVTVTTTEASVNNALAVPVDALLALSDGGYAIEVVSANGAHHLERVSLGLFDDADGLVQVTGSKVLAGQRIVQPNT